MQVGTSGPLEQVGGIVHAHGYLGPHTRQLGSVLGRRFNELGEMEAEFNRFLEGLAVGTAVG